MYWWNFVYEQNDLWNNCSSTIMFDVIFYVPVNNFSVMSGRVYLDWKSTKQGLMCLAQGYNAVTRMRHEPATSRSRVKHSTTEAQ